MTNREPDDLYDALRERLADYGQEPPAPLWVTIRAQLPAPVAAPQLRQRARRRWWAALGLLLLLSMGTWGSWQLAHRTGPGSRILARHAATAAPVGRAFPPKEPAAPLSAQNRAKPHDAAEQPAGQLIGAPQVAFPQAAAPGIAHFPRSRGNTSRMQSAAPAGLSAFSIPGSAGQMAATKPGYSTNSSAIAAVAVPVPGRPASARPHLATTPLQGTQGQAGFSAEHLAKALPNNSPAAGRSLAANDGARNRQPIPTATDATAAAANGQAPPQAINSNPIAAATAEMASSSSRRLPQAATEGRAASQKVTGSTAQQLPAAPIRAAVAAAAPLSLAPLAGRQARLALSASSMGVLSARADTLPPLPVAQFRRWMLQAMVGPALSYRLLDKQLLYDVVALPPNAPSIRASTSTYSVAQEQPAMGFGASFLVNRQLSGRWRFGTGLGYQEYATGQTVTVTSWQISPAYPTIQPDSTVVSTLRLRDTYRFLTIPVRLSYQLGTGSTRWHYGLLGGTDLAFYVGGSTSDGLSSKQWGSSGSPYRALSFTLSVGAEVSYRLAPRWEVLAQPTATCFLNSLARPASGYAARYPLAASGLLGISYGLR